MTIITNVVQVHDLVTNIPSLKDYSNASLQEFINTAEEYKREVKASGAPEKPLHLCLTRRQKTILGVTEEHSDTKVLEQVCSKLPDKMFSIFECPDVIPPFKISPHVGGSGD